MYQLTQNLLLVTYTFCSSNHVLSGYVHLIKSDIFCLLMVTNYNFYIRNSIRAYKGFIPMDRGINTG